MPLVGKRDEAENRFKEAERYSHPKKKEFDLDTAVRLLEEATMLKPTNKKYRQKLDEIREIKAKRSLKFSMRARDVGVATWLDEIRDKEAKRYRSVGGIVEQGIIRCGDEVEIRGHRMKVSEVGTVRQAEADFGAAGEEVVLFFQDWAEDDIMPGDELAGV